MTMKGCRIFKNCVIVTPTGNKARRGDEMSELKIIRNGVIRSTDGKIDFVGTAEEYVLFEGNATENKLDFPHCSTAEEYEITDAAGKVILPGFVDSHTHLIFGGFRPDEFKWRLQGDSYMSIMERGGGIQSTVNATRPLSVMQLAKKGSWFIDRMTEMGVTTVEAKSGYGLNTETELTMLEAIRQLSEQCADKVDIIPTFLGAHAIPTEYKGKTGEYVDHIIQEMLPKVKGLAKFCDIFTEKNVFEIEDSRKLLKAAGEMGFKLKLHADEIVTLGGGELAAELKAFSADHLLHVSDEGVAKMADAGVVATLLPLTAFALKEPYAPARKFIDAGAAVALATDLNPGSCFSGSIPLTIALACIYMQMSIEEVITALTINGAAAVDMADSIGSIEVGKKADLVILSFDNINFLPYYVGMNCVERVFKKGECIWEIKNSIDKE